MNQRPPTPELDAIPVTSPAAAPVILPLQVLPDTGRLSPLNGGAWRTSRRTGAAMVVRAVLPDLRPEPVRRVHRQRPADRRSYKGEILFPIVVDYPEEKFGGFLARTDYRDPVIGKEIADTAGPVAADPVPYNTHNLDLPVPAPAPPTWRLSDAQCRSTAEKTGGTTCRDIEWNWLGTDDQGRDFVARLLYGFRLSVLSVSPWRWSRRSSACWPGRCRAISAAGSTWCSRG